MSEIGIDPELLGDLPELRNKLIQKIREEILPNMPKSQREKAKKVESELDNFNEKQMLDFLIEEIIEIKCTKPSFIMNHPLIMSPLAKNHAQGRHGEDSKSSQFISERFELFINKMEVINSYSE